MIQKKKNNFRKTFFIGLIFISFSLHAQTDILKKSHGKIKGYVNFPSEITYRPRMKVCAVNAIDTTIKYCTETRAGSNYIISLPIGIYYVYAFQIVDELSDIPKYRAYYTDLLMCGMTYNCSKLSGGRSVLLKVNVEENKTIKNINPIDWYWKEILIIKEDTVISIKQ